MATLLYRLIQLFREVFEDDDLVFEADSQEPIEGWDSLAHVQLILALESEFDVTLTTEQAADMTSIPAILQVLRSAGVAD